MYFNTKKNIFVLEKKKRFVLVLKKEFYSKKTILTVELYSKKIFI